MTGCVNGAVFLNWVEEAKFEAVESLGWTVERMRAAGFMSVQIGHDTRYLSPARYRDEIEIVSRICDVRRARASWLHELYRATSGELLARNYSTGAFIDASGRPVRTLRA